MPIFFVAGLQRVRRTLSHAATSLPPPPTPSRRRRRHQATPPSLLPPRQAETAPSKQQLHLAPANNVMQTGACKQACSRPRALLEYTRIHRSKWYLNIVSYRAGASRCPPLTASGYGLGPYLFSAPSASPAAPATRARAGTGRCRWSR